MSNYELPPLPYDYDALEPHISEQVLTWHHDTHHQGYVSGWNSAEETLEANRESKDFSDSAGAIRNVTHNGSGHVLHTLFWQSMSPEGGDEPGATSATASRRTSAPTRAGRARSRLQPRPPAAGHSSSTTATPSSSGTSSWTNTTRARSGVATPSWRWTSGSTPTTTTTVPLAATSSTPSSRSSTGRSRRPATSRPSTASSSGPASLRPAQPVPEC